MMRFDEIFIGQELPPLVMPLTPTRVAAGAIATGDFEPIHHDRTAAEQTGRPDVFMNILMVNGLLQRCVTDWAGPQARISKIKLRLGAPSVAGDILTISGAVTEKTAGADGPGEIMVELRGTNRYGEAVRASVEGPITPNVPASILQQHESLTLYVDVAAASLLKQ